MDAEVATSWFALCDLGAPGWGEPWFPHSAVLVLPSQTWVWRSRDVAFRVVLFAFLPYQYQG